MFVRNDRNSVAALVAALALTVPAVLVPLQAVQAQPVVQALPDPAVDDLREAMQRLSRNPESLSALIAAGRASLALDDVGAAEGFLLRAEALAPEDGRVLAGLALVALARENPVAALARFDRAEQAGEDLGAYAAQRGLAYDLVGANSRAQNFYRQALERRDDPVSQRRLALSLAISGDAQASEATLLPLLQASDLAAFRTRAFVLAIAGRTDEAVSIAETMLPARLSQRLAPYLRYMPRLTPAQQAAAANFGTFPPASRIGQDDPAIAAFATDEPRTQAPRGADARLVPGGEPLGPSAARVQPAGEVPPARGVTRARPVASAAGQPGGAPNGAAPAVLPDVAVAERRIDLTEIFADLDPPDQAASPAAAADAVDITRISPARDRAPAAKAAPPPPPAHPSRHWVQVATGEDVAAFRWDWRRIVRNSGGLLDGREAFHAPWGASNRLVTGPFETRSEAQDLVTELKRQGVDSFRFTSVSGEQITPIR